jgi:hypothetical protein
LGKDTLILNMNPSADCPSRQRGLCKVADICYAKKAERQYPAVIPYRRHQAVAWETSSAEDIYEDIMKIVRRARTNETKFIRFSESGDFNSQDDVRKMSKIADMLEPHGIRMYGYTARKDLNFKNISRNMVVNGSSFRSDNEFTAVPKDYKLEPQEMICAGDCRECHACKNKNNLKIMCRYH